jgi:AcrR family transcriptional regulator
MSATESTQTAAITDEPLIARPKRADALRNYDKVIAAARDAFAERGASTSLEEIARRAEVGIGTLYRNFPNRQALLEAVYAGEVEEMCRAATDLLELEPWKAFVGWAHRFVAYMVTKQALAQEMLDYVDRDAPLFRNCRQALFTSGEPLLKRAQEAEVVRADTDIAEVVQMIGGIAKIQAIDPVQIDHILDIALDGLRYRASG